MVLYDMAFRKCLTVERESEEVGNGGGRNWEPQLFSREQRLCLAPDRVCRIGAPSEDGCAPADNVEAAIGATLAWREDLQRKGKGELEDKARLHVLEQIHLWVRVRYGANEGAGASAGADGGEVEIEGQARVKGSAISERRGVRGEKWVRVRVRCEV